MFLKRFGSIVRRSNGKFAAASCFELEKSRAMRNVSPVHMKTNCPQPRRLHTGRKDHVIHRNNLYLWSRFLTPIVMALFCIGFGLPTGASELWTGPSLTFVRPSGVDGTQPANQDRLTSNVWLTRDSIGMGLFNEDQESSYQHYFSPAGTEWAYGPLA